MKPYQCNLGFNPLGGLWETKPFVLRQGWDVLFRAWGNHHADGERCPPRWCWPCSYRLLLCFCRSVMGTLIVGLLDNNNGIIIQSYYPIDPIRMGLLDKTIFYLFGLMGLLIPSVPDFLRQVKVIWQCRARVKIWGTKGTLVSSNLSLARSLWTQNDFGDPPFLETPMWMGYVIFS